jgi:hypothetical protein
MAFRHTVRLTLALLGSVLAAGAISIHAAGPHLQAADVATLATVQSLPLPVVSHPAPGWAPAQAPTQVIDDFESPSWPNPGIWVAVTDLNSPTDVKVTWAPRDCQAASGNRSLWATGGGRDGGALPCSSPYPDNVAASALLRLDFTAQRSVSELWLRYDVWADATADEGLFISFLEADATGNPTARHIVYSATGRASAWSRDVTLDLLNLRDRLDPTWRTDPRSQRITLEFLFTSRQGTPRGEGIYVDNISLLTQEPTPVIVTPATPGTPTPTTDACTRGTECGSLSVRAYIDSGCDARFQAGIDSALRTQSWVTVQAGDAMLGTPLSPSGTAYFRLPYAKGVEVQLSVPAGYAMCHNSLNPVSLPASAFERFGRAKVDLRLTHQP